MKNNGGIILLEGIDGSGKTTIQDGLLKILPKSVLINFGLSSIYGRKNDIILNDFSRIIYFFIEVCREVDQIIKGVIDSGKIAIVERNILSALAYFGSKGADVNPILSKENQFLRPDLSFLLDCSFEKRFDRLSKRPELSLNDKEIMNSRERQEAVLSCYNAGFDIFGWDYETVDTGVLTIEETIEFVLDRISKIF